MTEVFDKEWQIRKIGGRLQADYEAFRGHILYFNSNHFPLLDMMGFNEPEDTQMVVDFILSVTLVDAANQAFIKIMTERVNEGKVKLSKILPQSTLQKISETPEEKREKKIASEVHRNLMLITKKLYKQWDEEYQPNLLAWYPKTPFELFRHSLTLSRSGLAIEVSKFIEIYQNFLEAEESHTKKLHQAAADAINRFFNGLEITEEEMNRYFRIEYGAVRVNPTSVNMESYIRLGGRGKVKKKKSK